MRSAVMVKLCDLAEADKHHLVGLLNDAFVCQGFSTLRATQISAWEQEIDCLQAVSRFLLKEDRDFSDWNLLLEYEIPRRQKRPDGILLNNNLLFVIEFKFGESRVGSAELWQTQEYALDLRDFHAESAGRTIIPILCVEKHAKGTNTASELPNMVVWPVQVCEAATLAKRILDSYRRGHRSLQPTIDPQRWKDSQYRPALTIIEAAERLFSQHDVREISHNYAANLTETTSAIVEHIKLSQANGDRRICFVTGVPGAGKTLTGLTAVHDPQLRSGGRPPGVFLSGNGPLVKIIRSALKKSSQQHGHSGKDAERKVSTFIQNVHAFLRSCGMPMPTAPTENVIVFDEAQRAWNASKMEQKHKIRRSEPDLILDIMERCAGWCVVIALVGGGQEIHEGEAGLSEWGIALSRREVAWTVGASKEVLMGGQSVAEHRLFPDDNKGRAVILEDERLHLRVSTRSWRAHKFNEWVNACLAMKVDEARAHFSELQEYPIAVTRDLCRAREWLRQRSGLEKDRRCGLLASSGATRLRAYGLELSAEFRRGYAYDQWFLAEPRDVRSSFRLEVAATEFEVQGLELDWAGLCWGNDLIATDHLNWLYRKFVGSRWTTVREEGKQQYIRNKYRVLLTRARQGMIIWVPEGFPDDTTLAPDQFQSTYNFLKACGVPDIADM